MHISESENIISDFVLIQMQLQEATLKACQGCLEVMLLSEEEGDDKLYKQIPHPDLTDIKPLCKISKKCQV